MGYTAEVLNKYLDAQKPENDFGENYEPLLEKETIKEADGLESLLELYRDRGEEFEDVDELWNQINDDWYWQTRERDIEQTDRIPSDSVEIRYTEDGEEYTKQMHIHGINHGSRKLMKLNPGVRDYIADNIVEMAGEENPLLTEENLNWLILQDQADRDYVEEIDDHKIMNEEVDLLKFLSVFKHEEEEEDEYQICH
jgi:hypothetical protein